MKYIYTAILLVFTLHCSLGQIAFQTNPVYSDGQYLSSYANVTTGDLDADGDLDILVSTYGGNEVIAWFENIDGQGNYTPSKVINVTNEEVVVTIADINGDGYNDVITNYEWYPNLGSEGGFGDAISISSDFSASVEAVDIDNDGDLDILLSHSWYNNTDGLGALALQQTFVTNPGNNFLDKSVSGDIDNDGDVDIISIRFSSAGNLSWYENTNGNGVFGSSQLIIGLDEPEYIEVGNIDNDSDLDIVTFSRGSGDLDIHRNLNLGLSWNKSNIYTNNAHNSRSMDLGDIDFDGDLDISIAFDSSNFRWFRNSGSGSFLQRPTSSDANGFALNADVDGDNDLDLVLINDCTGTIAWDSYPYTTGNPDRTYIETDLGTLKEVFFGDMDLDGDLDVLSYSDRNCSQASGDLVAWYENRDGYVARIPMIWALPSLNLDEIKIVDIDNDSDLDLVGFNNLNDRIFFYTNDGSGENFSYEGAILNINYFNSSSNYVNAFELADIDLDGDLDLVTFIDQNTVWLENVNNEFINETIVTNMRFNTVVATDIDNDGDADLLYSDFNSLRLIKNIDGQGTYTNEVNIGAIETSNKIMEIQDFDNDSDLDIICYDIDTNAIVWLENTDGQGTFSPSQILVSNITGFSTNITSLEVEDLDLDGFKDIAISFTSNSTSQFTIRWYQNLGNNTFSDRLAISPVESENIELFDYDNDGDFDILSASENGVLIYKNVGDLGNEISGSVSFDLSSNGCVTNNALLENIMVVSENGSDSFATYTIENGSFSNDVNLGVFDTSTSLSLPPYFNALPSTYQSDFPTLGNTDIINFCIESTGVFNDLSVGIYPSIDDPRPGFDTTCQIVYKNIGTTQLSGSVSYEFDDTKIQFLSASEVVTLQTANTLTFDFTDLNPFETRTIDLEFNVLTPPTTNIDDILVSTATVNPVIGDETEDDNVFTLEQTVIGSYDPNDITCLQGEEIFIEDADKHLNYLIRFQNTGTASAINVRVEHILDDKLDWSTMQLESLSHSGRVEIENETDVSFIFNNINLPDSTSDEPNSHGFIAFKIKPKSNVVVGDVISGVADIYFDFNPAIVTNTVNTQIVEPLSIDEFNKQTVQLFPNPTTDKLEIKLNQIIDKISIVDINGRLLKSITISDMDYSIDVSGLSKGVYFLEIQSGESKITKKFIKN